jgi:hypothetical protein
MHHTLLMLLLATFLCRKLGFFSFLFSLFSFVDFVIFFYTFAWHCKIPVVAVSPSFGGEAIV